MVNIPSEQGTTQLLIPDALLLFVTRATRLFAYGSLSRNRLYVAVPPYGNVQAKILVYSVL
jgi:hypothetical protein